MREVGSWFRIHLERIYLPKREKFTLKHIFDSRIESNNVNALLNKHCLQSRLNHKKNFPKQIIQIRLFKSNESFSLTFRTVFFFQSSSLCQMIDDNHRQSRLDWFGFGLLENGREKKTNQIKPKSTWKKETNECSVGESLERNRKNRINLTITNELVIQFSIFVCFVVLFFERERSSKRLKC